MDRCALFVDAGYVLADGAMAVHGTRRRESVSWDYGGLLQLLASQAMERSRLPLLRCYWYEATAEGQRSDDHEALADLPGVKLRVAKLWPGRREGAEIQRDLTTLARNKAVSDAMVVSAEENLAQVISDVQDMGMRVTLLNIAVDGGSTVSRALRQECDDIVEISGADLRPYVELIAGAEPPRADERDAAILALLPDGNGNGSTGGTANGTANSRGSAERVAVAYAQPPAAPGAGQQPPAASYPASAVSDYAEYPEYPDYQRDPGQQERAESAATGTGPGAPVTGPGYPAANYAVTGYAGGGAEPGADYGSAPGYGQAGEYAAAPPDQGVIVPEPAPPRQDQGALRPDARGAEPPARSELYAAPVAVPAAAEDQAAERPSARPRQESDVLRPVEAGYNPAAVREQYQADALIREPLAGDGADRYQPVPVQVPVPAGSAQVRRLSVRPGQFGPAAGQSDTAAGTPSGAQPVAPAGPMDARSMGYPGARASSHGGPRPVGAGPGGSTGSPGAAPAGGPAGFAAQPPSGPAPSVPSVPMGPAGQPGPPPAQAAPRPASAANPAPSQVPSAMPAPVPSAAQAYSGGQSGGSLADAVQSAHAEGLAFGESVARDAPALWLEAVLARKPRMPSDLEARLLQGSALPIDFLLHDEVRHALRRGFWDALERGRR